MNFSRLSSVMQEFGYAFDVISHLYIPNLEVHIGYDSIIAQFSSQEEMLFFTYKANCYADLHNLKRFSWHRVSNFTSDNKRFIALENLSDPSDITSRRVPPFIKIWCMIPSDYDEAQKDFT